MSYPLEQVNATFRADSSQHYGQEGDQRSSCVPLWFGHYRAVFGGCQQPKRIRLWQRQHRRLIAGEQESGANNMPSRANLLPKHGTDTSEASSELKSAACQLMYTWSQFHRRRFRRLHASTVSRRERLYFFSSSTVLSYLPSEPGFAYHHTRDIQCVRCVCRTSLSISV
jgi:hypothetical protein